MAHETKRRAKGQFATIHNCTISAQGPITMIHNDGRVTINAGGKSVTGVPV